MNLPLSWRSEIGRLLPMLALMVVVGVLFDRLSLVLLVGVISYLLWMIYNVYRLDHWLRHGAKGDPPEAPGVWGEIFREYYLIKQKEKRRKKRLAKILKQFRTTTRAMPDAAVVLNNSYEIEWINEASVSMLGFDSKRDVGQRVDNLLRQPEFVEYLRFGHFERAIRISSPVETGQMLSVRLVPFGKKQFLMVVLDVTENYRINQIRQDFVANTSHELRTPLTVLRGYLENMEEASGHELVRWKRPVEKMRKQADRMIRIVDDMLFLSEVEKSDCAGLTETVDVPTLLSVIMEEARALAEQQQCGDQEIILEADDNLLMTGEERELHAAFSNLVFNAVKYTPNEGRIHVTWEDSEQGPIFEVEDSGLGIPAHHLPRLTERFYRVDKGRSREKGGTGLGLAIVRHVINRHEAEFSIKSQSGVGSTFTIDFPVGRRKYNK